MRSSCALEQNESNEAYSLLHEQHAYQPEAAFHAWSGRSLGFGTLAPGRAQWSVKP
jgi:hypothetical protein